MRAIKLLGILSAFLLAAVAGVAEAQQDNRGTDFMIQRMKDRLKLNDEQAAKLKEIFSSDTDERTKLDDARTAKINAILDADQKKLYEDFRTQSQRGGNRGFTAPGAPGAFGGAQGRPMGAVSIEDAKRDLGLTDEQAEKLKPLYDEFNADLQKRAQELQDKGFQGFNLAESMQKYQDGMKVLADKVRPHLTDEQKPKLEAKMEQMNGILRFLPMMGGRPAGGGAPVRASVEDRVRIAMAALKVENADERAAISELVAKVVKAQYDLEDFLKASREKLAEAAKNRELSDAAVEDRIKEAQEDRRKREKEIAGLQKQLAEVVTNRQELELMAEGILK